MVKYDNAVIYEFAERLYSQARWIVGLYTGVGVVIGLALGVMAGQMIEATSIGAIISGALLGALGYAIGDASAFKLRLQAQTALCQARIEENTRPA